jgi:hypothetical protein
MSEDHDTTTETAPPTEQERLAIQTLKLLGPEAREKVIERIDPERRPRMLELLRQADGQDFDMSIDERRRLVRETSARMYANKVRAADETARELGAGGGPRVAEPVAPGAEHPLEPLRSVHPAALARAMQGERAEAWALVLDHLEPSAQTALRTYLDEDARVAIEQARTHQARLAPGVLATIERAIAQTIVPAALREHARLLSTAPHPTHAHAAAYA